MSKFARFYSILSTTLVVFVVGTVVASAQIPTSSQTTAVSGWRSIVPIDCQDADGCDICEITIVFTNAANLISAILSALSLLMFIIGGLFWIFSGGVEQRIETGKKIIIGTVSGLAIIFVAWLAVNIIVRTASLSGGTSTNKIFSDEWWKFEGCYPSLPANCNGNLVGEACAGTGPCSGTSYKDPKCYCWRDLNDEGDDNKCGDPDATSTTSVKSTTSSSNKTKSCVCADTCSILATKSGEAYTCRSDITEENKANYDIREDATCATTGTVCAKPRS